MTTKTNITLPPLPRHMDSVTAEEFDRRVLAWGRAAVEADRQDHFRDAAKMVGQSGAVNEMVPSDEELIETWNAALGRPMGNFVSAARAILSRYSSGQPAASPEPVVMKEICPECGHQFECFHNPYINQLRASPVAAPVAQEPVARDWPSIQSAIDEYLDGYELIGEPGDHTPTEFEKFLLTDAIAGLLDDEKFLGLFAAPVAAQARPQQSENQEALADTQRAIIEAAERRGYERSEAENVGYRTDAERYRWLKENIEPGYELPGGYYIPDEDTDTWDKTIDAARAAKGAV